MTKTVVNALRSVAVLVCIAVVCVALLAVCNMYFPKYVPTLDMNTASLINSVCPTGKTDSEAFDGKYIIMLNDSDYGGDIAAFNKNNKNSRAEILAVYGEPKGDNAGAYIIESVSQGYNNGDVVLLTAFKGYGPNAEIVGVSVKKKLNQSYWNKLPENVLDSMKGSGTSVDLNAEFGKTHATFSLTAIERAVNIAGSFAESFGGDVVIALGKVAVEQNGRRVEA